MQAIHTSHHTYRSPWISISINNNDSAPKPIPTPYNYRSSDGPGISATQDSRRYTNFHVSYLIWLGTMCTQIMVWWRRTFGISTGREWYPPVLPYGSRTHHGWKENTICNNSIYTMDVHLPKYLSSYLTILPLVLRQSVVEIESLKFTISPTRDQRTLNTNTVWQTGLHSL